MVSIGGTVFFVLALLLWKGVYSGPAKWNSVTEPSTFTETPPEFPLVHLEDFVPKSCGDEPTQDGFVKWNVLIQTGSVYRKCVGTLISRSFVLTSAKCVRGIKAENITMFFGQVHMGALPLCLGSNRCQQVRAAQVAIHPDHKGKHFNVALIKTELPVIETIASQPICLPLNTTVEDTRKDNYEDFRPRIQIGRTEMKIACGFSGVPIVVRDRKDQRYNIVGLANAGCAPTVESDATPLLEYMTWIISTLSKGEKELPMKFSEQTGSSTDNVPQLPAS